MPIDPHREALQKARFAIEIKALMREETVANLFASRGYKVLSMNDDQTRHVLGMTKEQKAADILAEVTAQRLIIAEVKGNNVCYALMQLESTARSTRGRYPHIECKIYAGNKVPNADSSVDLMGGKGRWGQYGFRAVRVFRSQFPGEWVLYEYGQNGGTKLVEIGSGPVMIAFGPH